nr:hypothetical protein [Streptomyces clavuligerus]
MWHSLVWHYLPPVERIRVDQVLSGYAENGHRAARIALEPEAWSGPVHLRLTLY